MLKGLKKKKKKKKKTHKKKYNTRQYLQQIALMNEPKTNSKINNGTTALKRSAEKPPGLEGAGAGAGEELAIFTLGPDATLNTEIHKKEGSQHSQCIKKCKRKVQGVPHS